MPTRPFVKILLTAAACATFATATIPSLAHAGELQRRFHRQQTRINKGIRNGQLTEREANADEARLQADRRLRNRDLRKNGGHLTAREQINLNRRLNNNSHDIYATKHNNLHQPGH